MTKTLHLTHPEFDVSTVIPDSILLVDITQPIYSQCYHTSLGDLSSYDILSISCNFDVINFIPNKFDLHSDIYFETALLLQHLSHSKLVTGYCLESTQNFLSVDVNDRPAEPMVWVFGCSHSYGSGLRPNELTFGKHISQATGLPLKTVAKPGSSTQWSLRHIMNAKFRPGDLVIWQLTSPERFSYGFPPFEYRLAASNERHMLETFTDKHILFTQLTLFNQGLQYLKSQPVKFSVISIDTKSSIFYPCLLEYTKHKEYCYALGYSLDLGTDQLHFGPLSHKALAQCILNHVNYTDD
jgi:hypothetical protein